jgi:hypothetical protein
MEKKPRPFAFQWVHALRNHNPKHWTPGMKAVLYALGTFLDNDTGRAVVSLECLATAASIHRNSVARLLAQAEKEGWVKRWKHRGEGQAWACTHYQALIPEGCSFSGQALGRGCTLSDGRLHTQSEKDARSAGTNSHSSEDSRAAPGSLENPAPPLSDREDTVEIDERHRQIYERLRFRKEERAWVAGLVSDQFPSERVSVTTLASLTPEKLDELDHRLELRGEVA